MNRTVGAAFLVLGTMAMPAYSASCDDIETVAKTFAEGRYKGHPVSAYMKHVESTPALKQLLIDAYSLPDYHSDQMQQKAVSEFVNRTYIQCVQE
ncbi:hypothetical protein [Ectopseudomonas oleovorans]|uniref:Putative secreted protein n=1 Tax=Ectopseudomonas oleovorans (strain CECT 5344) TaxID=1182590 RepID=W6R7P2_ECTO5|nr:hypothetical protein [Pseudomonas oleovorans]CDM42406.1 putative secreted protein [Pseudomonas oleovorans CECT 5344]CDR93029.1 putative secreted protein [Pseudomonas oleovorans]